MTGAVVEALRRPEGAEQVGEELGFCSGVRGDVGREVLVEQRGHRRGDEVMPFSEGDIAEAAGARVGGCLRDEAVEGVEEVNDILDGGGDVDGLGDECVVGGVAKGVCRVVERRDGSVEMEDEGGDQLVGRRGEEVVDILLVVDAF